MTAPEHSSEPCPCHSGRTFARCCGPLLAGAAAPTATALMRSRYCAYARGDAAYVLATWHPATRPATLTLDPGQRWIGLDVRRSERGGEEDGTGVVEFVARCKVGGRGHRLHEVSRFERLDGRWVYVDGAPGKTARR